MKSPEVHHSTPESNPNPFAMNRTQLSLLLGTGVLGLALMSSSSGVAEIQNQNRTGELGAGTTCNLCHGGGNYNASVDIAVLDPNSGQAVAEYLPGEQYVLGGGHQRNVTAFWHASHGRRRHGRKCWDIHQPVAQHPARKRWARATSLSTTRPARPTRSPWIGRHLRQGAT